MGKGKKNTMKHESKVDEQEAGASRKKQKVSSEDDTNDATLNSTGSPATDPAEEVWDVVRVLEDPKTCDCRTPECESKAVAVWAGTLDLTDEWPLCQECQERDFGVSPADITPPKRVESNAQNGDTATPVPNETDDKEPDEIATEEKIEATTQDATTANETCTDKKFGPSKVTESNNNKDSDASDRDDKELDEVATEEKTEATARDAPTADETCNDKECDPSKVTESNDNKDGNTNDEGQAAGDEEGEAEEVWDVKKVMSIADVKDCPIKCSTEKCTLAAACVYVSNLAPTEKSYSCLDCQEKDYGGWPEVHELPIDSMTQEHKDALISKCSCKKSVPMPYFLAATEDKTEATAQDAPTADETCNDNECSNTNDGDQADGEEMEEVWDVKKVMSIADVKDCPIKCSNEKCTLAAACVYVSNLAPTEKYYSCLDCQEIDYGGWPEAYELPIDSMTQEHKDALISKCSRKKDVPMPNFVSTESPSKECENKLVSHTITPLPNGMATQTAGNKDGKSTVTPSPAVGLAVAKAPAASNKPSKVALTLHRKWQEAAEAIGGPQARIVVSKPAAKKIIFDYLSDAFRPMNITQIHKALKAIVPSPVLKSCLDDMALDKSEATFADNSDDEEKAPKKKEIPIKASDDPYKGALSFKSGKSANTCLYYTDYSKLKNNGDGLPIDERNELSGDFHKTNAEIAALKTAVKNMTLETNKLLSEPTNEELAERLETEEAELVELREQVEAARKLVVNEKYKQQIKRRIETMTTVWRKRRRICVDFLMAMEENTEGTVSVKKCLKGDGQIDIDSDEAVVAAAVEYGKKKRARPVASSKMKRSVVAKAAPNPSTTSGLSASESFVAVTLDSQGRIQRVHLDDEE